MDLVRKEALKDLSVMASPMGYQLYKSLGFELAGTFFIQVPGEEERVVLQAMMYRPLKARKTAVGDVDGGCAQL